MVLSVFRKTLLNSLKRFPRISMANYTTDVSSLNYKTLKLSVPKRFVYVVELNRPQKYNCINTTMWQEIKDCFDKLAVEPECRSIVLSGAGKNFCAGIDLQDMVSLGQVIGEQEDVARRCKILENKIKEYQESLTSLEKCPKPVIAAVHGACIGAGVDMICSADIRYGSSSTWFQIKEVDIGMAADVGTLQRLPKIIGSDSLVRELVYTARKMSSAEAMQCGFISRLLENEESLFEKAIELAEEIAKKSPVAVQGSKISMVFSRDHSVQEGLDHIAMHNKAMLQSEDFINAAMATATKDSSPTFSKL